MTVCENAEGSPAHTEASIRAAELDAAEGAVWKQALQVTKRRGPARLRFLAAQRSPVLIYLPWAPSIRQGSFLGRGLARGSSSVHVARCDHLRIQEWKLRKEEGYCSGQREKQGRASAPAAKFKPHQLDGRDEPSFAHQTGDNAPGILLLVVAYRNTANIAASRFRRTDAM